MAGFPRFLLPHKYAPWIFLQTVHAPLPFAAWNDRAMLDHWLTILSVLEWDSYVRSLADYLLSGRHCIIMVVSVASLADHSAVTS